MRIKESINTGRSQQSRSFKKWAKFIWRLRTNWFTGFCRNILLWWMSLILIFKQSRWQAPGSVESFLRGLNCQRYIRMKQAAFNWWWRRSSWWSQSCQIRFNCCFKWIDTGKKLSRKNLWDRQMKQTRHSPPSCAASQKLFCPKIFWLMLVGNNFVVDAAYCLWWKILRR